MLLQLWPIILSIFLNLCPLLVVGDRFARTTCWCRNETQIAWRNVYKYHNTYLNRDFTILEKCVDFTDEGECLNYHQRQTMLCQDYSSDLALSPLTSVNTFCYHHRGHERFTEGNEDDVLWFNKHKRNIEEKFIVENATLAAVEQACGTICYAEFGLPLMMPFNAGHGIIESHAESWNGWWNLDICDGCGGPGPQVTSPGQGIPNDKGGPDFDLSGHFSPKGYYDTTGYDGKDLIDQSPLA
ncbi:MAG: hypothetical protein Q9219_004983 [cf. Caloplaca sp. 3 TL-2023]